MLENLSKVIVATDPLPILTASSSRKKNNNKAVFKKVSWCHTPGN